MIYPLANNFFGFDPAIFYKNKNMKEKKSIDLFKTQTSSIKGFPSQPLVLSHSLEQSHSLEPSLSQYRLFPGRKQSQQSAQRNSQGRRRRQKQELIIEKTKNNFGDTTSADITQTNQVNKDKDFSFFNVRTCPHGFAIRKFISHLMKNGNQAKAEKILLQSLFFVKRQYKPKILKIFFLGAINNVKPLIELKSQQTYKSSRHTKAKAVPIKTPRAYKLAIEWIIQGAKQRPEKNMALAISRSLFDAYQKKGYAIKKRNELHILCKMNFFKTKKTGR